MQATWLIPAWIILAPVLAILLSSMIGNGPSSMGAKGSGDTRLGSDTRL